MRCPRVALLFLLAASSPLVAAEHVSRTQQTGSFKATLTRTVAYDYLLALPHGYAEQPERRWPTIVFLHGSGERGSDLARVLKHGPPKLIEASAQKTGTDATAEAGKIVGSPGTELEFAL